METFAIYLCVCVGLAFGNVVTRDAEKSKAQETDANTIQQADSPKTVAVSYSVMKYFLRKLPSVLQDQILITDEAEKIVLENYAKSQSVPTETLDAYKSAKQEERALLKRLLKEAPIVLSTYKTVRKGVAWNYTKLDDKFVTFFQQPSDALTQYEALKKDELASLDGFLAESSKTGAQGGTKIPEAQEAEKRKTEEDERAKAEKAEKEKNQKTQQAQVEEAERGRLSEPEPATTNKEKEAEEKRKTLEETEKSTTIGSEIETTKAPEIQKNEDKTTSKESAEKPFCGKLDVKLSDEEKKELVRAHNNERKKEHASNMLKMEWNEELAIIAQDKANTCEFSHSKDYDCNNVKLGQNLFIQYQKTGHYCPFTYSKVALIFARERDWWNNSTNSCTPGQDCTPWQILTAAKTYQVGCGFKQCPDMHGTDPADHTNFVVCNYRPYHTDYKRGERCSDCGDSTIELGYKEHVCEEDLCRPCVPTEKGKCKCGTPFNCENGAHWSEETCGCKCPREYYGTYCEKTCACIDRDKFCDLLFEFCYMKDHEEMCQKSCKSCDKYPRPASCNAE